MSSRNSSEPRVRSVPVKRPYLEALAFAIVHYLSLVAAVTMAAIMLRHPEPTQMNKPLGAVVGLCFLTWLFAYFRRRAARCPLCQGTPLLDSGAVKHARARRLPPLNHGVSALLSLLFTGRFRCMYCHTSYDIKKPATHERR